MERLAEDAGGLSWVHLVDKACLDPEYEREIAIVVKDLVCGRYINQADAASKCEHR